MVKKIINRNEYIHSADAEKFSDAETINIKNVELFGKKIELYDDPWMWHFHLKITDICNAKCSFCVEQGCKKNEQPKHMLENIDKMLTEMENNGILYSVSVTGGEPTLFKEFDKLCDILESHDIKFLTMNTNGFLVEKHLDRIDGLFDWINISRHRMVDEENNEVFKTKVLSIKELKELRNKMKHTKMRIQCVMETIDTPELVNQFIDCYSFADDISFRRLMKLGSEYNVDYNVDEDAYTKVLEYCYNNFEFVEQTIQDYYVYEIYKRGDTPITFSYSNMEMLRRIEKVENDGKIREFVCHPNGVVSGSWKMDNKIILK